MSTRWLKPSPYRVFLHESGRYPIPDAISQLEKLDRTLLTRRDIEQLFGVSTARAATLMQTFGAEMTGYQRTLPRTKLLRQLRKHRAQGRLPRLRAGPTRRRRGVRPRSGRVAPGAPFRCVEGGLMY